MTAKLLASFDRLGAAIILKLKKRQAIVRQVGTKDERFSTPTVN
jgi:hypothetical protein